MKQNMEEVLKANIRQKEFYNSTGEAKKKFAYEGMVSIAK